MESTGISPYKYIKELLIILESSGINIIQVIEVLDLLTIIYKLKFIKVFEKSKVYDSVSDYMYFCIRYVYE